MRRLYDFFEKLEQAKERLSYGIEGQYGAQEIDLLINEDWSYISEVKNSRDELEEIE